jgi:hypothetical protein
MKYMLMKYRSLVILLILSVTTQVVSAQEQYSTRSNRALRLYLEGKRAFEFYDFRAAEQRLKEAVAIDENFFEAHMLMGELYYDTKRFEEAAQSYQKAVNLDIEKFPNATFFLASSYFKSGSYQPALKYYTHFTEAGKGSATLLPEAEKGIANSKFSIDAIANPVPFTPVSLGVSAGKGFNDYSPSVTADGNMIMFTRETILGGEALMGRRMREDFFISYREEDGSWGRPVSAGSPLNTMGNEGAQTIGPEGTICTLPPVIVLTD